MLLFPNKFLRSLLLSASCLASATGLFAQDASQLGFSDLQAQANTLVERGQLSEALPLLEELIKRVDGSDNADFDLDFPIFITGTAYIQLYVSTGNAGDLNRALEWYDRLEKDYPNSINLKQATLKRVDILRALKRTDEAIQLMQAVLSGRKPINLQFKEQIKMLKDLCQIYYGRGELKQGIPYFKQLVETARSIEDKSLGAAATFEAQVEAKQLDEAIKMLPLLAKESSVRYLPRLNVALLKASDTMVENERFTDAALLLNLIKTTDIMIDYNERKMAEKKNVLDRLSALGGNQDRIGELNQEITGLEATLKMLRDLPTLRSELLVRRARNFTKTNRPYESFWMFFDLLKENPNDKRTEFYHYAAFSGARQIGKKDTVLNLGRSYRKTYPDGSYFSDVSAALVGELQDRGEQDEMLATSVDFLNTRPLDPFSSQLLALWASSLLQKGDYVPLIDQIGKWRKMHNQPVFEDALYYWPGLAYLQLGENQGAITEFDILLERFPTSAYAADSTLRKGIAHFYLQEYDVARATLQGYASSYPQGDGLDQAYYFIAEVAAIEGDYAEAMRVFQQADAITTSQGVHDGVAFRMGELYEVQGLYAEMLAHFRKYVDTYGEDGRLSDALFQVGRAYEYLNMPNEMLELYRISIDRFISDPTNKGVDALIEGYAEKYFTNKKELDRTVQFLDQLRDDLEFRTLMVTDSGALFEEFYSNPDLKQTLYNELRSHPNFTEALLEDLSLIDDITSTYRNQFENYPAELPEEYFRDQLAKHKAAEDRIAETRMLMGLYRNDIELEPSKPFDKDFLTGLSPRVLLYIADYERLKRIEFAIEAWSAVLADYPDDDAAIVSYMRLAGVSVEFGDQERALGYLNAIEEQFPGSPQLPLVILRQGELMTELGRGQEARDKYQYILRVPEWRGEIHARALLQTGDSFMAEAAYAQAHGFYERTFLGYSHFGEWCARAYLADADALVKMGDPAGAKTTLTEAIEQLEGVAPDELFAQLQEKFNTL